MALGGSDGGGLLETGPPARHAVCPRPGGPYSHSAGVWAPSLAISDSFLVYLFMKTAHTAAARLPPTVCNSQNLAKTLQMVSGQICIHATTVPEALRSELCLLSACATDEQSTEILLQ